MRDPMQPTAEVRSVGAALHSRRSAAGCRRRAQRATRASWRPMVWRGVIEEVAMAEVHPYYEAHRGEMEAAMLQRLDLAEEMLRGLPQVSDVDRVRREVMAEFAVVL